MAGKHTLRLILGDQLNSRHSWFNMVDDSVSYLMMEVRTETDYATHHIQKILGFFAAMRQFASELEQAGHRVIYLRLDDPDNAQSFDENIARLIHTGDVTRFSYQLPDEYRVDQLLKAFCKTLAIPVEVVDSEHFLSTRQELGEFFQDSETYVMERFYRAMRQKHNVLMEGAEPVTGQWNYYTENRKKLPASHTCTPPLVFDNDVSDIAAMLKHTDIRTLGHVDPAHFIWPVSRNQALRLLRFFVEECLPLFGTFEDAMTPNDWSLYHSRLSFCMNTKMLSPKEVIDAAVSYWTEHPYTVQFNQLEGFVRQILGWREYMRGIYWLKMPGFAEMNFFGHDAGLPQWYWNGNTRMHCLRHAITQSLNYAYAHHVQCLMVTGNFALLAGVAPDEVDEWYLGIYIDAIDWVEITNTRGMSQFADGGIVGTKPYVSSASYIDKMSHYCCTCYYKKNLKTGDRACPFNSLYWNFYARHENLLGKSQRTSPIYRAWHNMDPATKEALLQQAAFYLKNIDKL